MLKKAEVSKMMFKNYRPELCSTRKQCDMVTADNNNRYLLPILCHY